MQSKISFFNKTIFKKNLARTSFIGVIYFLFLVVACPLSYASLISYSYNDPGFRRDSVNSALGTTMQSTYPAVLMFFLAIITLMFAMSFLYNKRDINMMHAFPVSRKTLFGSAIVSTFIVLAVPTIAVAIIMQVVAIAEGATSFWIIYYWLFEAIASLIFFMGFSLFCMMLSGQVITTLIFYTILNFVWFGMQLIIRAIEETFLFGLGDLVGDMDLDVFSPVVYISARCGIQGSSIYDTVSGRYITEKFTAAGAPELIGYIIVGILFAVFAYILYKKKPLETVNDFIAVPFIKPIFTVGMSFFCSAGLALILLDLFDDGIRNNNGRFALFAVISLIIGAVLYFVIQMFIERSSRVFRKKNFTYCVIYTVCALLALVSIKSDLFKVERRVPQLDEIEWAGVECAEAMVFDDAADIEVVRAFHSGIIDLKSEIEPMYYSTSQNPGNYFNIKYKLKDGSVVTREYYLADYRFAGSESYKEMMRVFDTSISTPKNIKEHVIGSFYKDLTVQSIDFSYLEWDDENRSYQYYYADVESGKSVTQLNQMRKEVYEAFLNDLDAGCFTFCRGYYSDDCYANELGVQFTLNDGSQFKTDRDIFHGWNGSSISGSFWINIDDSYKNTLAVLKQYGYYESDDQLVYYSDMKEREHWDSL